MCIYDLYISINVYIILLHVTSLVKVLTNCFYMFVFLPLFKASFLLFSYCLFTELFFE